MGKHPSLCAASSAVWEGGLEEETARRAGLTCGDGVLGVQGVRPLQPWAVTVPLQ